MSNFPPSIYSWRTYVYVYEGSSISIFPHSKSVYDLTHWHWHHTKSYKILNELDAMKLEENRTITAYALYERLKTKFGYIWPKIFQFDHLWPSMTRFNQAFQFDPTDDLRWWQNEQHQLGTLELGSLYALGGFWGISAKYIIMSSFFSGLLSY